MEILSETSWEERGGVVECGLEGETRRVWKRRVDGMNGYSDVLQ